MYPLVANCSHNVCVSDIDGLYIIILCIVAVVSEQPQFMDPQHPNVYVYENNSMGERQNLILPCTLMDTTNVTYRWFRAGQLVPAEMVDQVGTLTMFNITEGEYASQAGVEYYCVASRNIGKRSYTASVRSRTITVFYACKLLQQCLI